jgi:hypothetical protein
MPQKFSSRTPGLSLNPLLTITASAQSSSSHDKQVDALLAQVTLDDKIGPMPGMEGGAYSKTTIKMGRCIRLSRVFNRASFILRRGDCRDHRW